MKRKIKALSLLMALTMLAACGGHTIPEPSLDISKATYVHFDTDWNPVIQGVTYDDNSAFIPLVPESGTASDYADSVICYFVNDDHYVYYCEAEGLAPEEWLIMIWDDRRGNLQHESAYFIKAITVTVVPPWLKPVET